MTTTIAAAMLVGMSVVALRRALLRRDDADMECVAAAGYGLLACLLVWGRV